MSEAPVRAVIEITPEFAEKLLRVIEGQAPQIVEYLESMRRLDPVAFARQVTFYLLEHFRRETISELERRVLEHPEIQKKLDEICSRIAQYLDEKARSDDFVRAVIIALLLRQFARSAEFRTAFNKKAIALAYQVIDEATRDPRTRELIKQKVAERIAKLAEKQDLSKYLDEIINTVLKELTPVLKERLAACITDEDVEELKARVLEKARQEVDVVGVSAEIAKKIKPEILRRIDYDKLASELVELVAEEAKKEVLHDDKFIRDVARRVKDLVYKNINFEELAQKLLPHIVDAVVEEVKNDEKFMRDLARKIKDQILKRQSEVAKSVQEKLTSA